MSELFTAKIRKIGTSVGILIPKGIIEKEKMKIGEEMQFSVLKQKRLEEIEKMFGIAKGAKPFRRDHGDRVDRW